MPLSKRLSRSTDSMVSPILRPGVRVARDKTNPPHSVLWVFFGRRLPRKEVVYWSQTILIYIVVTVAMLNLSFRDEPDNLWITLLGSCLGYILPSPVLVTEKT